MKRLPLEDVVERIRRIHAEIRDRLVAHIQAQASEALSAVVGETAGDTIYAVDRVGEWVLRELFERELARETSFVLVGEGLADEGEVFPDGTDPDAAAYRVIVDPIDGTRALMYDKRSAWVLTGVAENRGPRTSLRDVVAAVQTEIPTQKQYRADTLWAIRGTGAGAVGLNRLTGESAPLRPRASRADTIEHGFAMVSRFFPGGKDILAAVEEDLVRSLLGPVQAGKARLFEDQYISTGGQFYELMAGHDRFNADLRPNLARALQRRGEVLGICCHPYDVCTELIARESGVIVTDVAGGPLDTPLDTTSAVAWVGYANERLRAQIEPVLQRVLRKHGML